MRIQHAEMMQLRSEVEDNMAASVPTHATGYLTDCSFYGEERCVSYFTFSPKDGSGPRAVFTGIGPVADKTARACAAAALERMLYALGRAGTSNVGASCEDHAAMNELDEFLILCEEENIPMKQTTEFLIKMGDDFHKMNLVDRAASLAAFGADRGVGVHSHLQLLYQRFAVRQKFGSALSARLQDYMGSYLKIAVAPMETRWGTIGAASVALLEEEGIESENHEECFAVPHAWEDIRSGSKLLLRDMTTSICEMQSDPRIMVAVEFEAELYSKFYLKNLHWNKKKSSLGYNHMFKGGDMPQMVEKRRLFWEKAVVNPRKTFPSTFKRIDSVRGMEGPFGGGEYVRSAEEVVGDLTAQIQKGVEAGLKKFEELYACWFTLKSMFWHLRSKPHRQSVAAFMARSLGKVVPAAGRNVGRDKWLEEKVVGKPGRFHKIPENEKQEAMRLWIQAKQDAMRSWIEAIGMPQWDGVVEELVLLASSHSAEATLKDVGLHKLHNFLYYNVDCCPVMNLIVELSFSSLKTTQKKNEGAAVTDMALRTKMEVFHPARLERLHFKTKAGKEYKSPETLDGARQLVHWVSHAARVCKNFVEAKMVRVPSMAFFKKIKTSNIRSDGNKKFVEDGKDLKQKRSDAGQLTVQEDHQARVLKKICPTRRCYKLSLQLTRRYKRYALCCGPKRGTFATRRPTKRLLRPGTSPSCCCEACA